MAYVFLGPNMSKKPKKKSSGSSHFSGDPNLALARRLLWQARAFARTASALPPPGTPPEIAPLFVGFSVASVVNHCLSVELYLKTHLAIEGRQIPRTHALLRLFELLSSERQQRLGVQWIASTNWTPLEELEKKSGACVPRTLQAALAESNDAFVLYRYAHESGPHNKLPNVWLGAATVILDLDAVACAPEIAL